MSATFEPSLMPRMSMIRLGWSFSSRFGSSKIESSPAYGLLVGRLIASDCSCAFSKVVVGEGDAAALLTRFVNRVVAQPSSAKIEQKRNRFRNSELRMKRSMNLLLHK